MRCRSYPQRYAITEPCVIITYNKVMPTGNPFIYGEVVTATAFADRERERERLDGDLAEGQKVFLISPRRYGKSSLVRGVMQALAAKRILTVEVTVAASSSYVAFLEAYAQALVSAETPPSKLRRWTEGLLHAVRPEMRSDAPGSDAAPRFSVAFPMVRTARDTARLAAEVFALPARIAAARRQRMAIALDEFQAIAAFDGGNVEHALRAAVQEQRAVGYVFAGSEPSLMGRMAASGLRPEDGLGAAIVELAENVPYDVQRLAHETWDDVRAAGRKSAGLEDLHLTLSRLLNQHHTVFEESWQRLTLAQRAVLRAIVLEGGRELLSADVRSRHRLPGASSVQSGLAALVRQDIVMKEQGRYVVNDSLYREWMARRTF